MTHVVINRPRPCAPVVFYFAEGFLKEFSLSLSLSLSPPPYLSLSCLLYTSEQIDRKNITVESEEEKNKRNCLSFVNLIVIEFDSPNFN